MIVSLHVATGGLGGAVLGSRLGALALGPILHLLGDLMPHEDIDSRGFEALTGSALLGALALRHGPTSPLTIGAAAASAPDVEHVFRSGRELFPSHAVDGWHRSGDVPAWTQLVAAATIGIALLRLRPEAAG